MWNWEGEVAGAGKPGVRTCGRDEFEVVRYRGVVDEGVGDHNCGCLSGDGLWVSSRGVLMLGVCMGRGQVSAAG